MISSIIYGNSMTNLQQRQWCKRQVLRTKKATLIYLLRAMHNYNDINNKNNIPGQKCNYINQILLITTNDKTQVRNEIIHS